MNRVRCIESGKFSGKQKFNVGEINIRNTLDYPWRLSKSEESRSEGRFFTKSQMLSV